MIDFEFEIFDVTSDKGTIERALSERLRGGWLILQSIPHILEEGAPLDDRTTTFEVVETRIMFYRPKISAKDRASAQEIREALSVRLNRPLDDDPKALLDKLLAPYLEGDPPAAKEYQWKGINH